MGHKKDTVHKKNCSQKELFTKIDVITQISQPLKNNNPLYPCRL